MPANHPRGNKHIQPELCDDSLELLCKQILEQDLFLGLDLQQLQEEAHERRRRLAVVHASNGVQRNRLVDERLS